MQRKFYQITKNEKYAVNTQSIRKSAIKNNLTIYESLL